MTEHEHSDIRWLHEMLTATARAVHEQRPVDRFEVELERDRETVGVTGARIQDNRVYATEITIRVRFTGDVTIRPGEPTKAELLAGNHVTHPAVTELEKLLMAGPLGPLAQVAEEVAQLRGADESSYNIVHRVVEKVQGILT